MRRMILVAVVVAAMALVCGPALAEDGAGLFSILDVGPAQTLGPGGELYPLDITLKVIPVEYDGPIPTDDPLAMVEGIAKYLMANLGADILCRGLLTDQIDGGLSLPVVNTKVLVPVRAGVAFVDGVGTRLFLRLDLLGIITDKVAPTGLAGIPVMSDTNLSLAVGADSAMLVYARPL